MKLKFNEYDHANYIQLTPETPEEVAMLLRTAMHSKTQPLKVELYFGGAIPTLTIDLRKVNNGVQSNYISRKRLK